MQVPSTHDTEHDGSLNEFSNGDFPIINNFLFLKQ